jgi:hypothetical protein
MENRRIQHSTEHQRETRAQYQRNRRQRMSSEQRERELLRRRENYNQTKKKGNKWKHLLIALLQQCHSKISQIWILQLQGFNETMTSKLDQVLHILMTLHLVSYDKNYRLMYYIQFYIVTHSQIKIMYWNMQVVDFHQILKVLMTMKQDQAEQILVTLYMVTPILLP